MRRPGHNVHVPPRWRLRAHRIAPLLLVAATAAACAERDLRATPQQLAFCGERAARVEMRIDRLLARMSLAQKVAQLHGADVIPRGGLWITTSDEGLGIPGLAMTDGPRGVSRIASTATAFPVGVARGATFDPELEHSVGEAMGREARAVGASVLLAPTINLLRHPRWGRAQESYGEDPWHLARMAVGFIRGVQEHVIASAKHFAANSIEDTRFGVSVTLDERTLREIYLPQFRAAVQEAQVGSVMSAYNRVNGTYCSEHPHLLTDILKGEWGFQGFVESDWVFGTHSTAAALSAGLDVEMPVAQYYGESLRAAVTAGEVEEALVDAAVRRVLRAQLCFALDSNPPRRDPSELESPAHLALALEVARQGTVLLKNQGDLLPFDPATAPTIALVGPLADVENIGDAGSSEVTPSEVITVLEGLREVAPSATVIHLSGDLSDPTDRAAVAASDAVVVVCGLTADDEGEGLFAAGDRSSLALAPEQVQLIQSAAALSDAVVVVLEGGSAITVDDWESSVQALLMAWYPGARGGTAIAEILFGQVNPAGRLPVAFPRKEDDLPPFDNVSSEVTYGYWHGYRHLDHTGVAPRFPFGFGLGYTTFAYGSLRIEPVTIDAAGAATVSFEVTNTGSRRGTETPQLYVSYPGSRVERVVHELKAFTRITLEPGETRTVTLPLAARDLGYYDVTAAAWTVEPLAYGIAVGPHSAELPLAGVLTVR